MTARSRIIVITGVDGSGKTTLTDWLKQELQRRGHNPGFVWSRFNNYVSLPLLAITRLTGHNYYEVNAGVKMGYHDFQGFPMPVKLAFVAAQIVDVNLATLFKVNLPARRRSVTICERGPWDTLVDVVADTGMKSLLKQPWPACFFGQLGGMTEMIFVDREPDLIEQARNELKFDRSLRVRHGCYRRLAELGGWTILDNNRTIGEARADLVTWLDNHGY